MSSTEMFFFFELSSLFNTALAVGNTLLHPFPPPSHQDLHRHQSTSSPT